MTRLTFPQNPFMVGFDQLFNDIERMHTVTTETYPPHNLVKVDDDKYLIAMAIAGFSKADVDITLENNILTVMSIKEKDEIETDINYLHKGISDRRFKKTFRLSEHVEVTGAWMDNGILTIQLTRVIPEEMKPKKIDIK